jgi:uncharacterized small protein (DUF1192 family)|tara:strand:- start:835 stop:1230 length:396 start_codon:yes stop_codon:yes gene_type:complete
MYKNKMSAKPTPTHKCAKHPKKEILECIDFLTLAVSRAFGDRYNEAIREEGGRFPVIFEKEEWVDKKGKDHIKIVGWDCAVQKLAYIRDTIAQLEKEIEEMEAHKAFREGHDVAILQQRIQTLEKEIESNQ